MMKRPTSRDGGLVVTNEEIEAEDSEIEVQKDEIRALREEINMLEDAIASGRIDQLRVQWGPQSKAKCVHLACVGCLGNGRKEGTLREAFAAGFGELHFKDFPYKYKRVRK